MMPIRRQIIFLLLGCLVVGSCGVNSALVGKVDMMEKDIGDLRRQQDQLSRRMDELQIQLSLMNRKLGERKTSPSTEVGQAAPELKVVKIRPEQTPSPKSENPNDGSARAAGSPRTHTSSKGLPAVDPHQVNERLAVDHAAARRPINGAIIIEEKPVEPKVAEPTAGEDATKEFDQALSEFAKAQYETAAKGMRKFFQRHPNHELVPDALYILGQSEFSMGDVPQALKKFEQVAERYASSKYAAEALLMKGRCHEKSGQSRLARDIYLQVVESYPLSDSATEANRRLASIR